MTSVCHSQILDEGTHPFASQQVWLSHSSLGKAALPMLPKQDSWQSHIKSKSHAWQHAGTRLGSLPSLQKRGSLSLTCPKSRLALWVLPGRSVKTVDKLQPVPAGAQKCTGCRTCLGGPPFPWGRARVESDSLDLSSRLVKTRLTSSQFTWSLIQGSGTWIFNSLVKPADFFLRNVLNPSNTILGIINKTNYISIYQKI